MAQGRTVVMDYLQADRAEFINAVCCAQLDKPNDPDNRYETAAAIDGSGDVIARSLIFTWRIIADAVTDRDNQPR
jgi:hypothetical protein